MEERSKQRSGPGVRVRVRVWEEAHHLSDDWVGVRGVGRQAGKVVGAGNDDNKDV